MDTDGVQKDTQVGAVIPPVTTVSDTHTTVTNEGATSGKIYTFTDETLAARLKRHEKSVLQEQNGEYKPLFEQTKAELEAKEKREAELEANLKALQSKVKQYEEAELTSIDGEIAQWPEEYRVGDPGKDKPQERKVWASHIRPLVGKLTATTPPPGTPKFPKPAPEKSAGTNLNDAYTKFQENKYGAKKG